MDVKSVRRVVSNICSCMKAKRSKFRRPPPVLHELPEYGFAEPDEAGPTPQTLLQSMKWVPSQRSKPNPVQAAFPMGQGEQGPAVASPSAVLPITPLKFPAFTLPYQATLSSAPRMGGLEPSSVQSYPPSGHQSAALPLDMHGPYAETAGSGAATEHYARQAAPPENITSRQSSGQFGIPELAPPLSSPSTQPLRLLLRGEPWGPLDPPKEQDN